jgi:hypothetical protein
MTQEAAMRFGFDQRPARARRLETVFLLAVPTGAAVFPLLDGALASWLGGFWGTLAAIVGVASPLAALQRAAFGGRAPRQAAAEGVAFGAAVAFLYGWVFAAPFIPPPGF